MDDKCFYIAGNSQALIHCAVELNRNGIPFTSESSEADVLLYDVPTAPFVPEDIRQDQIIIGGNLQFLPDDLTSADLLQDPWYLAHNALLTAQAAVSILLPQLACSFPDAPTLILGWGRIGKCLDQLLRQIGIPVSVYARNPEDRAMLSALGYTPVDRETLSKTLSSYRCLINTAPAQILTEQEQAVIPASTVQIDLASQPGLLGPGIQHARGLPGKYKPAASGKLIAQTILSRRKELGI